MTVASLFLSIAQTGVPTISDRPSTTTSDPASLNPVDSMSFTTPAGVHGVKNASPILELSNPTFAGWNPSTSLSTLTLSTTIFSSSFSAPSSGSCTRIPLTLSSLFAAWTNSRISLTPPEASEGT